MGDLDKGVHRKEEPSPYEKIIISPVDKDSKGQESFGSLKYATRAQTFAALVSYFKKILPFILSKGKGQTFDRQRLLDHIAAFREQLALLAHQDQSHDPDFALRLTELWHNLLDDCNSLPPGNGANEKVKFLIQQIQNFPPGADHTLGYYFDHYAGKDWIPFPFLEILEQLHKEYQASPVISVLNQWISILDEIKDFTL